MQMSRVAGFIAVLAATGCYVSIGDDTTAASSSGDGDGDSTGETTGVSLSGDGDGDPTTGDGDGDPSTGDGDGDPGDGDGDPTTGDGDGDPTTGDGDGDGDGDPSTGGPEECSPEALELIDLVNEYRAENALPAIPASPSLCTVATAHVHDLNDNSPHTQPGGCNLHSWSDQGPWSACCYTPDHAQAQCMWDKPGELSIYPGNGYENAAYGVGSPAQALDLWKSSPPHNEVILNLGIWANYPWQALGADVYQGYSVLWFGAEPDPAG
jgi:hypothetical protein